MASLYELSAEMEQLMVWMNDPMTDDQAIKDTLDGLQFELEAKAENYCKMIRQFEADAAAYKAEAERFKQKQSVCENNAKRMKEALLRAMVATGHEKGLDAGLFKLKVAGNGGLKPLIIDGQVPEQYINYTPSFDNDSIRKFLDSLDENDKCDWAHYGERGTHLSIR